VTTDAVKSSVEMAADLPKDKPRAKSAESSKPPQMNNPRITWIKEHKRGENIVLVGGGIPGLADALAAGGVSVDKVAVTTLGSIPASSPYDCAIVTSLSESPKELPLQLQWVAGLIKPYGALIVSVISASPIQVAMALQGHLQVQHLSYDDGVLRCLATRQVADEYQTKDLYQLLETSDAALSDRQRRLQDVSRRWQQTRRKLESITKAHETATKALQQADEQRIAEMEALQSQFRELQVQNLDLLAIKAQLENDNRTLNVENRKLTRLHDSVAGTLAAVYRSDSYRLGKMLVEATQSWRQLVALPRSFWILLQDGKKRRALKAAKLANTVAAKQAAEKSTKAQIAKVVGEDLNKYLEAFRQDGAAAVVRLIDPNGDRPARANAMSLLAIGKNFREQGAKEIEWPLAELALKLFKDEAIWRGYLWAAVHANKPELAYRAIQTLEHLSRGGGPKKQESLKRLQEHRVYRLHLLDRHLNDPVTPITPEPNRAVYILHNSLPFSSGGYATRSHGIASGLKLAGYEVIMMTRPGFPLDINTSLSVSDIPADEVIDGIRYERVLEPKRSTSISRDGLPTDEYLVAAADALTDRLRVLRPSVVIAASNYQTALPAMIAARRLGLPFVYEVRGFWEVTRISRQPEFANTIAYGVDRAMEGGLAARADQVFTLTEAMRDELIDRGVEAEKIVLLPNSCDPTRFHPGGRDLELAKRLDIPAHVPVIGYIGTFVHYEGLEDLAGACAQLKAQNIEFRLLMVGNEDVSGTGVGPITQAVRDIAEQAGFSKWLIMPGRVPHSEVESYYSLIDIAPFPRKPLPVCEMVSPMKPLEAMAMKKAVLVSSVRALSEMVSHEHTGLVFEKGNVADFSSKLRLLIEQPEMRKRFGENGRVWVEQERTWLKTGGKAHDVIDAQVLHPKYLIHAVRTNGAHIAELARYQTLLTRAFAAGEENPVVPVSASKSLYFLHSSLPHLSGGYATRAHGIVKGTLAAGFDITPYTRPGFPIDTREVGPDETFNDADVVEGISYHRIFGGATRGAVTEIEYMLSMIDEFEKVLRHERPSIVHGRSTYLTALPALIAARRVGLPFVYEVSGLWELVHASRDKTGALQTTIDRIRDLETFTILNSNRVVTLTEGMVDELVSRGADREKIHLIPNSVSPELFEPMPRDDALAEQLGIPPGVPVMGYVGTFVDYEGLDDLIRAAKRIIARGIDCRVLLVGDGRGQQNHKALARQLGDKLILPGRVPHEVVKNYYSLIDVLVYARKPWPVCETVSPMKPFEALALEKAVVASSVRALSQIIIDGETGLIFEKGDADNLADKVVSLFESPELRTRLGKNGRQWVIENRTWKNAGEEMAQVYRKTLSPS